MLELNVSNAAAYLASRKELPAGPWRIVPLGGGVSNTVLLAECGGVRLVVKQSLGKLRVQQDWFADRTRIHREASGMLALQPHLPPGSVPPVVFQDPENCIYAMEAASPAAHDWKTLLLSGQTDESVAGRVGEILAAQILASRNSEAFLRQFGDLRSFDQLRLDPYYRFTASRHPDLAPYFDRMVEESLTRRYAVVHGDFSPKNLLVDRGRVVLIDWEVIHYGDPSFDAAFLLNHLLLKCAHQPQWAGRFIQLARSFWRRLAPVADSSPYPFEAATLRHLGLLHLARVDGKSPAEYLTAEGKETVRRRARCWILNPPSTIDQCLGDIAS